MRRKAEALPEHIEVRLDVTRQAGPGEPPYLQSIPYETDDPNENVASALKRINDAGTYRDLNGKLVEPIEWENSCLQKKCGACAMVIDGRPALACGTLLRDHKGAGPITLAPLAKFPVVRDLRVDRGALYENLRRFGMWEDAPASQDERRFHAAYEGSRCLQCGCCLEVCPNFAPGEGFFGAAGFVPAARVIATQPTGARSRVRAAYLEHEYAGCGKSLACQDVCPALIDIEGLLARNAAAVLYHR